MFVGSFDVGVARPTTDVMFFEECRSCFSWDIMSELAPGTELIRRTLSMLPVYLNNHIHMVHVLYHVTTVCSVSFRLVDFDPMSPKGV